MDDDVNRVDVLAMILISKESKNRTGWGRVISACSDVFRPEYLSDLHAILGSTTQTLLPYGCSRSYGDVALNATGDQIQTTRLNRMLSFDKNRMQLVCESGVTLGDIQRTFLPRGMGLQTSPGTGWVTVGGAIANDIHGKNHDRVGSFSMGVVWFELLCANGDIMLCSREKNQMIFFATIGGIGLTGVITKVCLQLVKQPMSVLVQNEFFSTPRALIARLLSVRETATYSVAWLDLLGSGERFGRSILSLGEPDGAQSHMPLCANKIMPRFAPFFLNSVTMRAFNALYYDRARRRQMTSIESLMHFLYPLDTIQNWNTVYGEKGFYQFQCVIPDAAAESGIAAIIDAIRASAEKPYLSVLKTLGSSGEGLLSFSMKGLTIALDFPNKKNTVALLKKLEAIVVSHQGRIYFAKDACVSPDYVALMYPRLAAFQAALDEIDPNHKWTSMLSQRLHIRDKNG